MGIQVIEITDTERLAEAMSRGETITLKNGQKLYTAYDEQESEETLEGIARGEADIKAGRYVSKEQIYSILDEKVEALRREGKI